MLRKFALLIGLFALLLMPNSAQASKSGGMKGIVTKFVDKAAVQGMKQAGMFHCPRGEQCYCSRPLKNSGYKAVCKYYDKRKMNHTVKEYDTAANCTILCLGVPIENAKENVHIRGTEEKPETTTVSAQSANCERLPYPNGQMVNCCGSKGTSDGKRVCLSENPPKR